MRKLSRKAGKYSRKLKKYFNKTTRKKAYNKIFDKVYKVDHSKCQAHKHSLKLENRLYANLCRIAIDNPKKRPLKYKGYKYDSKLSNTTTACYFTKSKIVLATRGTEKTSVRDINMDSYILFNKMKENSHFKITEILLLKIALKYPNHKIELTGYSLGGSVSLYLLDNYKDMVEKCVVFNPGITIVPYGSDILKRYANNNKTTFIIKLGDPISNAIAKYNPKHLICLKKEDKPAEELHSLYNFI